MKKTLALFILILALALPVARAEDGDRTVYPLFSGDAPKWSDWQLLMDMPGIESYQLTGMNSEVFCGEEPVALYCSTRFVDAGLEPVHCLLTEGNMPGAGEVLAAAASGHALGEALTLTCGDAALELTVSGLYEADPAYYEHPESVAAILISTEADFFQLLDPEQPNAVSVDAITLESADLAADFLAEANERLDGTGIRVVDGQQMRALISGSSPAEGQPLAAALTGTDLHGAPLPEEILAPGGVTMVNVWATFCGPCIGELPELAAWNDSLPEHACIIGIVCDIQSEDDTEYIDEALYLLDDAGADYINLIPNEGLYAILNSTEYVPTTIFVDSEGNQIGEAIVGADVEQYKDVVNDYLSSIDYE